MLADYNWAPNADNPSTGGTCYRVVNNTLGTWDNELCVATQSGRWYTGQLGHWAWRAPGGSRSYLDDGPNITFDGYVYRAYVRHSVTRFSTSNYAYMYAGIRSGRTGQWIGMNRNIQEGGAADDVRNGRPTRGSRGWRRCRRCAHTTPGVRLSSMS